MLKYSLLRFSVVFIPRMPVPLVAPRNFAPTIAERQLARDELSGVQTSALHVSTNSSVCIMNRQTMRYGNGKSGQERLRASPHRRSRDFLRSAPCFGARDTFPVGFGQGIRIVGDCRQAPIGAASEQSSQDFPPAIVLSDRWPGTSQHGCSASELVAPGLFQMVGTAVLSRAAICRQFVWFKSAGASNHTGNDQPALPKDQGWKDSGSILREAWY